MKCNLLTRLIAVFISVILGFSLKQQIAVSQNDSTLLTFPSTTPTNTSGNAGNTSNTENPGTRPPGNIETLCQNPNGSLKALVPVELENNSNYPFPIEHIRGGYTFRDTPMLWFYVPYDISLDAKLSLSDENGLQLASTQVTLPSSSGIIGMTLPPIPEVGQRYRWTFSLICNPEIPSRNITVRGGIWRLEPPEGERSFTELANADVSYETIRPRILDIANAGIWYDTLTSVGLHYYADSTNERVALDWRSLLESVSLGEYTDVPIIFVHSEN
ncbi:DUF928 domain-containing protein [Baaleninema simplex]|uniref:DUF928 domain-containing protein n=1 Tax=Baaleninema simplex TaxID=2862350 RepID=UPI00037E08BC|nr:DUF928 domain-containing protein [Baaleninema simplex]